MAKKTAATTEATSTTEPTKAPAKKPRQTRAKQAELNLAPLAPASISLVPRKTATPPAAPTAPPKLS